MTQLPDIQKVINEFTTQHDRDQDSISEGGFLICPHYGPWIASLNLSEQEIQELTAFSALQAEQEPSDDSYISSLLDHADLPQGWKEAYLCGLVTPVNEKFLFIVKSALYGDIDRRLFHNPPQTAQEALALAYLVEATTGLEAAWINRADAHNYIPMGDLRKWWPLYISTIDGLLSPQHLRQLSEVAQFSTETEALSLVTPPQRLSEIYGHAVANPNLPYDFVNSNLDKDYELLFHPNADRERAWEIIQSLLADGDFGDLTNLFAEFHNMRDDNWFQFSGFATDSPQATWIRSRIRKWCEEQIEDDDERADVLEELGLI